RGASGPRIRRGAQLQLRRRAGARGFDSAGKAHPGGESAHRGAGRDADHAARGPLAQHRSCSEARRAGRAAVRDRTRLPCAAERVAPLRRPGLARGRAAAPRAGRGGAPRAEELVGAARSGRLLRSQGSGRGRAERNGGPGAGRTGGTAVVASGGLGGGRARGRRLLRSARANPSTRSQGLRRVPRDPPRGIGLGNPSRAVGGAPADGDRKSTRLNSSHRTISYAVFCLKKKTLAPTMTTHSASHTVTFGQTTTFTVVSTSTAPMHYTQRKSGTGIIVSTEQPSKPPATAS